MLTLVPRFSRDGSINHINKNMKLTESVKVVLNENKALDMLEHCKQAIERIEGLMPQNKEFRDVVIIAKIRSAADLLSDVAESLE